MMASDLKQRRTVAIDQRRNRHHRIDLAKGLLALLALHQIDFDDLVGLSPFRFIAMRTR